MTLYWKILKIDLNLLNEAAVFFPEIFWNLFSPLHKSILLGNILIYLLLLFIITMDYAAAVTGKYTYFIGSFVEIQCFL